MTSGPIFIFCAPGLDFGGAECVGCHFHVSFSRNRFRRCRVRQVPFSSFALPYSFSVVPSASGPVFMLCAPVLIFNGTEGVRSRFHILCARTHFRRYRGRQVPFSCFALPDSFSAVPIVSGHVSRFALPDSFLTVPRVSGPVLMFCAPRLVFGGTEGVGSLIHVLRSRTRFGRY
jgi:hypothetical protein